MTPIRTVENKTKFNKAVKEFKKNATENKKT